MKLLRERKRNRLKEYNYSQDGYYFVTICTKNRENNFGEIKNGKSILNEYGEIVKQCWLDLPNHYPNCLLDEFVIMPNHLHGIVIIDNEINVGNGYDVGNDIVGNGLKPFPTTAKIHGLSEIIRGLKTFSSKNINIKRNENKFQWQKSFYDHIIRNEKLLHNIRQYIQQNPANWELEKDRNHLSNIEL